MDEGRENALDGGRARRFEQAPRSYADARLGAVERGQRIRPEAHGILFRLFERDPGDLPAALFELLARHDQQRRLAESCRGSDDGTGALDAFQATPHDGWTCD